jgi:hypothetical protein
VFAVSAITGNTTWTQLTVTYVSGSLPANSQACVVSFVPVGDLGSQGSQGNQGDQGSGAVPGGSTYYFQYNDGAGGFAGAVGLEYQATAGIDTGAYATGLSQTPLGIFGASGQTANLLDFRDYTGATTYSYFNYQGYPSFGIGSTNRLVPMSSIAAGNFSTAGDAVSRTGVLRCTTTNGTQTTMTFDGAAASTTNQVILENDSTLTFCVYITARRTDANDDSAGWKIEGVIDRNATAGTTALVGSVIITTIGSDSSWTVDATADTTNGGLSIKVTGAASKTINWVGLITTVEVVG